MIYAALLSFPPSISVLIPEVDDFLWDAEIGASVTSQKVI